MAHEILGCHLGAKKDKRKDQIFFLMANYWFWCSASVWVLPSMPEKKKVYGIWSKPDHTNTEVPFDCLVMDCLDPLFHSQKVEFNYALVICDNNTRYPFAFPLRSLSAKNVCNALLQLFQITGIPSTIRSHCGSNFTSSLTTTFLKLLGCTSSFNVPHRPQQSGLCECLLGTLTSMISKVAAGNPKMWHRHFGFFVVDQRHTSLNHRNSTFFAIVGTTAPRPIGCSGGYHDCKNGTVTKSGQNNMRISRGPKRKSWDSNAYAKEYAEKAQGRYVSQYNLRASLGKRNKYWSQNLPAVSFPHDGLARRSSKIKCQQIVIWWIWTVQLNTFMLTSWGNITLMWRKFPVIPFQLAKWIQRSTIVPLFTKNIRILGTYEFWITQIRIKLSYCQV